DLVAALVVSLQRAGKLDDTIIIYTSDNGFLFGQHGRLGKSVPYEEAIKVPLVIRGPGIPENQTPGQLLTNLDVLATIVELAGASPGATLDGHSLGPLFADSNAPWRRLPSRARRPTSWVRPSAIAESARPPANTSNSIPAWRCFTTSPPTRMRATAGQAMQPMLAISPSCAASTKSSSPALAKPAGCREHRRHKTVGLVWRAKPT